MPQFIITKDRKLFDVTAVDNIFIAEFMPHAPDFAVKVYLYGLMMSYNAEYGSIDLACALGMSEADVLAAFKYWEEMHLIKITLGESNAIQYLNIRQALLDSSSPAASSARYAALLRELQAVLGTRFFSGRELEVVYDWIEVFGFDEESVVEIVRHCLELKGNRVHINYMDALAKRLAADGCICIDEVRQSFEREHESISGAARILKRWRLGRRPTEDEIGIYNKWKHEWNFSDEAIDLACADVLAADRPNFKYLDSILSSYYEKGGITAKTVAEIRKKQDAAAELARRAFVRAELKRTPTSTDCMQFMLWSDEWKMSDELILYAAELSSLKHSPFASMKRYLSDWHSNGIANVQAARERCEREASSEPMRKKAQSVNHALNYKQNRYSLEQLKQMGLSFGEDVYED